MLLLLPFCFGDFFIISLGFYITDICYTLERSKEIVGPVSEIYKKFSSGLQRVPDKLHFFMSAFRKWLNNFTLLKSDLCNKSHYLYKVFLHDYENIVIVC